ncbi:WAT1-related protein At5g40240-like isoform X1 [Malus domestica]|uniref:WAT1-related protein At5g40240-like isoform X1 n=1 Tax=Malus domestica TaxID=3750 RepID=UPI0039760311
MCVFCDSAVSKERERERERERDKMSIEGFLPFIGMVIAMMVQTGSMVVNKAAMSKGTNAYIIVVYANAVSALILLPSALIFHRSERPPLTFSILCKIFLLALFCCTSQIFGNIGIEYSSPTLSTAMLNLIPAFTFILAIIFRMERVYWRSSSSQAKVLGTIVSITGAFVVTFYKGLPIIRLSSSLASLLNQLILSSSKSNWILGGLFLAADALSTSLWYILQATIVKKYPAIVFIVFFQCLFATMQSAAFTLIAVRGASAWEIRLDVGIIAILYTGIVSTVLRYSLVTWCVKKAGAFYCSMFKPLGIIFGVIMGVIFLGDSVYLGSWCSNNCYWILCHDVGKGQRREADRNRITRPKQAPFATKRLTREAVVHKCSM